MAHVLGRDSFEATTCQSLTQSLGLLLNDDATSDFRIIGCKETFRVHKLILSSRSEYFRELFSRSSARGHGDYDDYMDLSKDNLFASLQPPLSELESHGVLTAFLKLVYTNDYPASLGELENGFYDYNEPIPIQEQTTRYHVSISVLTRRFLVKGGDNVIADTILKNSSLWAKHVSKEPGRAYVGPAEDTAIITLRTDESFLQGMQILATNAKQGESDRAVRIISSLLANYLHHAAHDTRFHEFMQATPYLWGNLLWQLMHAGTKGMCPSCCSCITHDATKWREWPDNKGIKCERCSQEHTWINWMKQWNLHPSDRSLTGGEDLLVAE